MSRSNGAAAVGVLGQPAGEPAGGVSHLRFVEMGGGAAVRVAVGLADGGRVDGREVGGTGGAVVGSAVGSAVGDSLVGATVGSTVGSAARGLGFEPQPASNAHAATAATQVRRTRGP
jgi:hypothetical protein